MSTTSMSSIRTQQPATREADIEERRLEETIERVCARIAPTWPLDRFIAVNPFWGLIETPMPEVAARLASMSGARLLMPRAWYRQAYREGRLRDEHLEAAIEALGSGESLASIRALLEQDDPLISPRARVVDVVDAGRDLGREASWRSFVGNGVSQLCAAYFDDGQATFGPARDRGLYAAWRRQAQADHGPALLMGLASYRSCARELPGDARELIATALEALKIERTEEDDYLWGLLLDQNGWASWCAYRRFTARLAGNDDDAIVDLLAIRLAWEWMLHRTGGERVAQRWASAKAAWARVDDAAASPSGDWVLQTAIEMAWQGPVLRAITGGLRKPRPTDVAVQAVFCIDVRSEVFRRALEVSSPSVQTLGFAGFFGLPIAYRALGSATSRPQLPGLLSPRLVVADEGAAEGEAERRRRRFDLAAGWRSFKQDALSTFTFVEAMGVTYAMKLIADSLGLGKGREGRHPVDAARAGRPRLVGSVSDEALDVDARCDLAIAILRGMSLTRRLARLVLLVGHGSTTRNNPHAAGLDCGACCGQTGEVNARVAAALLNEPEVRAGLAARGLEVPQSTWFVAALHDTTTDEVELFDTDTLPASHRADLEALRGWLRDAGSRARCERAASLGHRGATAAEAARVVRARSSDWAQLRAEWGLANNAAFIAAPREHCQHLDLGGRSFLHEYRHEEDEGYAVLEQIMTAPMVVAHWINLQYHASTVDNARYGSGNKVLHNVVGGHIGVFEGNGGDLRIGLPMQSLHDGARWVHEPLRLCVLIEAPRQALEGVLAKHHTVRALVDNGWLSLFQLDERAGAVFELRGGRWHRHAAEGLAAHAPSRA